MKVYLTDLDSPQGARRRGATGREWRRRVRPAPHRTGAGATTSYGMRVRLPGLGGPCAAIATAVADDTSPVALAARWHRAKTGRGKPKDNARRARRRQVRYENAQAPAVVSLQGALVPGFDA